jgi:two-component system, cell cycle sensor histidine kinase and response regulator CckA
MDMKAKQDESTDGDTGATERADLQRNRLGDFAAFAVESMSDGAFLIAQDARIVYVNRAACSQLGYTERELLEMTILDINPTVTRESWNSIWGVTVNDKVQVIETVHRTKSGRIMPVDILANFIELDGQQYSLSFSRDITSRKEMEARIRQSEKLEAIGQLAGGIAHDFNNQLAGILSYANLLKTGLANQPALAEYADNIIVAGQRSAGLTAQLLAFARQGKYRSVPVDVHGLIDETVQMLTRSINKNIAISTDLQARSARTIGDPAQLENAFLNLAINARDAMPAGGTIVFSTRNVELDQFPAAEGMFEGRPGKYIQIRVADTGAGMSNEVRQRIFEPFFTTKEHGKGTGMGLASVYGTVKSHKGAVEVHSQLGTGTDFILYLPCSNVEEPVEADRTADAEVPTTIAAHVLAIDDEPLVLGSMKRLLENLGCRVTTCATGAEAVERYRTSFKEFDAVILDLIMPGMSGKEAFTQMRAINPRIVALVISGYSLEGDVQEMLDAGVKGFLEKPFKGDELARTLSRVLAHGHAANAPTT